MEATLTSKGQVTIPKAVRDTLKLHVGDRIEFLVDPDGSVRIVPATRPVTELKALLLPPPRTLGLDLAELRVQETAIAWAALPAFQSGEADFADHLIGAINAESGCETTFTFDKRAARSDWHTLL
jgi:AbrB family looped-hinge helix DNA binding protein